MRVNSTHNLISGRMIILALASAIAIPIGAVARTQSDEVVLSWSTDEVGALTPLPVHRWQG